MKGVSRMHPEGTIVWNPSGKHWGTILSQFDAFVWVLWNDSQVPASVARSDLFTESPLPPLSAGFKVVEGSISNHCCFDASVVKEGSDKAVCECFHTEDAERICEALNK